MENQFRLNGYTFKQIKSNNPHRPYRVRCIETGDEKDSAISYEEAASLLTGQYAFAKSMWEINCKDEKYVKEVFSNVLLGRKKSECDELVKSEIVEQEKIKGTITSIISDDKFAKYKEYQTEFFVVKVLFENGLMRKSTKITIEKRNKDVQCAGLYFGKRSKICRALGLQQRHKPAGFLIKQRETQKDDDTRIKRDFKDMQRR